MRAGRLLELLLVLQHRGRTTAGELARVLHVSERTVLRDIEALSGAGVPVYSIRGPQGGFALLDPFAHAVPPPAPGLRTATGRLRRVRVRLSPAALRTALVTGRPEGWRRRPHAVPDPARPDWVEGSFRFDAHDVAVRELLALGPEVEIVLPAELRSTMASIGRRIADLHAPPAEPSPTVDPRPWSRAGPTGQHRPMDNMTRLEQIVARLPETARVDVEAWGDEPTFRVRGKSFVFTDSEARGISVKLPKDEAEAVVATDPGAEPTGYGLGRHGWVSIRIDDGSGEPRWREVEEWVRTSYTLVAPKSLARSVLAEDGVDPTAR